ncbi:MAG: hypothetical protein ACYCXO_13630 [Candidatus Humimicrobiaceae bacterium]
MQYLKFFLVWILGGTVSGLIGIGGGVIQLFNLGNKKFFSY